MKEINVRLLPVPRCEKSNWSEVQVQMVSSEGGLALETTGDRNFPTFFFPESYKVQTCIGCGVSFVIGHRGAEIHRPPNMNFSFRLDKAVSTVLENRQLPERVALVVRRHCTRDKKYFPSFSTTTNRLPFRRSKFNSDLTSQTPGTPIFSHGFLPRLALEMAVFTP